MKQYLDERINNAIKESFEVAVKNSEWNERYLNEWNILFECIDKMLEYVNNDYKGELRLNVNMWWVLRDTLEKILNLYNLTLDIESLMEDTENTLVITKNKIKKEIFDKMEDYGWGFDDNSADSINERNRNRFKSFLEIYKKHYDYINELCEYLIEKERKGEDKETTLKNIDIDSLNIMIGFMSDFLRAFNEIDY